MNEQPKKDSYTLRSNNTKQWLEQISTYESRAKGGIVCMHERGHHALKPNPDCPKCADTGRN